MAEGGNRELGLFGDWESACAVLQCQREECMVERSTLNEGVRRFWWDEQLPYMATLDEVKEAFERHLRTHEDLAG